MSKNSIRKNKLKFLIAILAFIFISQNIHCQTKIYFDEDWKTTTKAKADFYRIIDKKNDSLYHIQDFYIKGVLQMEGHFSDLEKETLEGEIVWFSAIGKIAKKENYKKGTLNGLSTVYLENGKIDYTTEYKNGEIYDGLFVAAYYKQWYKEGKLIKQAEFEAPNDFRCLKTTVFGVDKDTVYWMSNSGEKLIGIGVYLSSNSTIIDGLDITNDFLIAIHTNYKNSKREGIQQVFYEGKLLSEQTFVKDVVVLERSINPLTGEFVEINFKHGEPYNGRLFQFDQVYEFYHEFIYKDGVVILKNQYEPLDGKLQLNEEKSYKKF